MNPEFRRQLWLQFSVTRVGTLVLLLGACFTAVFLSTSGAAAPALTTAGATLFGLLVLGLGTVATGASVMDEIADRTWDQQRMSAMQPWAMTWGKLAGASAYSWLGGALCLLVALPSALEFEPAVYVAKLALVATLAGVFMHSLLMAVNLQIARSGRRMAPRGGILLLVLVLLLAGGPLLSGLEGADVVWWGQTVPRLDFALASMGLFTACALFAAWRSMAEVLAVRQLPWGWPTMALVFAAYLNGFARTQLMESFPLVALGSSVVFTYAALLTEPQSRPHWQRLLHRLQNGQWHAAWLQLPRWPTTVMLAAVCALALLLLNKPPSQTPWPPTQGSWLQALTVVLLMLRDSALALYFAFSLSIRRPVMAFVLSMLVLYGLLPWLLGSTAGIWLPGLVQPLLASAPIGILVAAIHLVLASVLLHWRWRVSAA